MLKKILGTTSAKGFNAILYMAIVLLSTNSFGTEGYGKITLFVMAVSLNATLAGIIVSSLIYLTSRSQVYKLAFVSYTFSLVAALIGSSVLQVLGQIPDGYLIHTVVVSILCGLFQTNQQLLVGLGKVKNFNINAIVQVSSHLLIFAGFFFSKLETTIAAYIFGMGASQLIGFIPSIVILSKQKHKGGTGSYRYIINEGFKYGWYSFSSNLAQFINYRLPSYLVANFMGDAAVGIYGAAIQIAESIWLICRSFAMVVLSEIARSDISKALQIKTTQLMRLSVYLTTLFAIGILVVPSEFYELLLSKDFTGIKPILFTLGIGILSFAAYAVLTAYFAGIGRPAVNTTGAFIGAAIVTVSGLLLTPVLGTTGAALSSSLTHMVILSYTIYRFNKHTGLKLKHLVAVRNDVIEIKSVIKQFTK